MTGQIQDSDFPLGFWVILDDIPVKESKSTTVVRPQG